MNILWMSISLDQWFVVLKWFHMHCLIKSNVTLFHRLSNLNSNWYLPFQLKTIISCIASSNTWNLFCANKGVFLTVSHVCDLQHCTENVVFSSSGASHNKISPRNWLSIKFQLTLLHFTPRVIKINIRNESHEHYLVLGTKVTQIYLHLPGTSLQHQTKQIDNAGFMYHMIQCVNYKCCISTKPKTNDSIRKLCWPSTRFS